MAVLKKPAGGSSCVFTFDVPPEQYFRGQFRLLSSFERKVQLLQGYGIDEVAWMPFGPDIASLDAHEFVRRILVEGLRAEHVVCGFDYHFGNKRSGNVHYLKEQGERYGFEVTVVPSVQGDQGQVISSTLIRGLISEGDLTQVVEFLGYYPSYAGIVVRGQGRGRQLGFPTANLHIQPDLVLPCEGVYLTWCILADGRGVPAVTSIGRNPTFEGSVQTVEAFILDFDADLYGQKLEIQFLQRMRDMVRYNSEQALIDQIETDVNNARRLLSQFRLQDARVVLK
jgi:riboflavin kinase/FMN adenylyltransferase